MTFAFLTGLFGTLHCFGMCAPLMLSMPFRSWQAGVVYQAGRILVYVVWGSFLGFLGNVAYWVGLQQVLSVGFGVAMLAVLFLPHFSFGAGKVWSRYVVQIRQKTLPTLTKQTLFYYFVLGVFNGLLPCGLVYVAAIGASFAGYAGGGALYMLFFGLGTLPMPILIALQKKYLLGLFKHQIKYLIPTFLFFTAVLLIVRGLNLDIPYVSPSVEKGEVHSCH